MSFECDFIKEYPNIYSIAFDKAGGRWHELPENILYFIKFVGPTNTEDSTDLKEYIEPYDNIFIKMDIEGGEWLWLDNLGDSIKKIKQITFEAHGIFPNLYPSIWFTDNANNYSGLTNNEITELIIRVLKKINETHYLVHIHENNLTPFVRIMDNEYPTFYELTFIRKDCEINGFNNIDLPIPELDYPCMTGVPDRILNYWPFKI